MTTGQEFILFIIVGLVFFLNICPIIGKVFCVLFREDSYNKYSDYVGIGIGSIVLLGLFIGFITGAIGMW